MGREKKVHYIIKNEKKSMNKILCGLVSARKRGAKRKHRVTSEYGEITCLNCAQIYQQFKIQVKEDKNEFLAKK